jgi:hypothetical protein
MNKFRFTLTALAIMAFTMLISSSAQAQATRTWVSGVGDDANPCSRTAPCKTFAGAISKTALGGEIDALDPGGFGAVTITKSITIDGTGTLASILAAGTNGVNANDSASASPTTSTITLRGLSINGATSGFVGVNITSARSVIIENCVIFGFRSGNGNGIRDTRAANQSPAPQLFVSDTSIRDNSSNAVSITGASPVSIRAFLDHVRIQANGGAGVLGSNSSFTTVRDSMITGNLAEGIKVDTNAQANVISTVINGNLTGVLNSGGSAMQLADVTIFNNATGISGTIVSFGNNNIRNNTAGNTLGAPAIGQQ